MNDSCSKYIAEAKANEAESQLSKRCEVDLRMENNTLLEQLQQMKDKTIELESSLAQKTESEMLKVKAAQQAEAKASLFEKETAKATEELKTLNESLTMLRSRSSALEKVGEEADAEIVSLLRRAQEAESWQATIREGFAKVMAVQPDEPFEQTWQKLEEILQSSLAEAPIPCNVSCIEPRVTDNGETTGYPDLPLSQWDGKEDHIDQTRPSEKQVGQSVENLSPRAGGSLKALKHGDRVASLPKYSSHVSHIVPFASIHDKLSREESLSLLNDPAELEMLFMSTPDLQGGPVQSDPVKETQEDQKLPIKSQAISCEPKSSNPVQKQLSRAQDNERERVSSAVESFDSEAVERSTKSELPKTKRKVVSFEGTHVFTETEVGRARRMSDATDNSSGRESESKPLKKTHKRTYSRLRQSVAQEESSIETTTNVQIASKTLEGRAQNNPTNKAEHSSNTNLRPTKRPRDAAHGPGRRLSPKGLASGSSRSNAVNQDNTLRSRGKRRTRGMRPTIFKQRARLMVERRSI